MRRLVLASLVKTFEAEMERKEEENKSMKKLPSATFMPTQNLFLSLVIEAGNTHPSRASSLSPLPPRMAMRCLS